MSRSHFMSTIGIGLAGAIDLPRPRGRSGNTLTPRSCAAIRFTRRNLSLTEANGGIGFTMDACAKPTLVAGFFPATTTDGKKFSISYRRADETELEAHVALLGCGINSKIGGGENNGRQLTHDFVVLDHRAISMTNSAEVARADIAIEKFDQEVPQKAVAIWITRAKQLAPLQATGGWLGNVALKK